MKNKEKYPEEIKRWRQIVKKLSIFCKKENISLDGDFTIYSGNDDDFQINFRTIDGSGIVFVGADVIIPPEEFEDE